MAESRISRESFSPPEPNSWKPWLVGSLASLVILGIAVGLLLHFGLLFQPKDDTGTKTLAAALGLIGAVLTAALTLVGTVVKYSIDDRNARLAAVESSHNFALALDAEKRSRLEAAIRAVDLLSDNNQNSTPSQIGGALLALVSLGELDLALSLLQDLWRSGLASPSVAHVVLKRALETDSEDTLISAATVLLQNADQIQQTSFHIWPIGNLGWKEKLPSNARLGLVEAAATWLKEELAKEEIGLTSSSAVLYKALADPNPLIKDIAAAALRPLIELLPSGSWTSSGDEELTADQIGERLNQSPTQSTSNVAAQFESQIREVLLAKTKKPAPKASPTSPNQAAKLA